MSDVDVNTRTPQAHAHAPRPGRNCESTKQLNKVYDETPNSLRSSFPLRHHHHHDEATLLESLDSYTQTHPGRSCLYPLESCQSSRLGLLARGRLGLRLKTCGSNLDLDLSSMYNSTWLTYLTKVLQEASVAMVEAGATSPSTREKQLDAQIKSADMVKSQSVQYCVLGGLTSGMQTEELSQEVIEVGK